VDVTLSPHELLNLSAGVLALLSMERSGKPLSVVCTSSYPEEEQLNTARTAGHPVPIPSDPSSGFIQSDRRGDGIWQWVHGGNEEPEE
jgi:hypothetical protein